MNTNTLTSLPVSCLAEFVTRGGRSPDSILRPFKFKNEGEGQARIVFRPPVIAVVRKYFRMGGDVGVFDSALQDWLKRAEKTDNKAVRAKFNSNIAALNLFRRNHGHRTFDLVTAHRISCEIEGITFTASPDLWVRSEEGQRLIRLGFGRRSRSYVDIVLTVMRRAALLAGYRVHNSEAVYLEVISGNELVSGVPYKRLARTLAAAARQIALVWPRVGRLPVVPPAPAGRRDTFRPAGS